MLHGEDGFCNLREACACLPACHPRGLPGMTALSCRQADPASGSFERRGAACWLFVPSCAQPQDRRLSCGELLTTPFPKLRQPEKRLCAELVTPYLLDCLFKDEDACACLPACHPRGLPGKTALSCRQADPASGSFERRGAACWPSVRLARHPKAGVSPAAHGIGFAGCRHWPGCVLVRQRKVRRTARRFRGLSRCFARPDASLPIVRSCQASSPSCMRHGKGESSARALRTFVFAAAAISRLAWEAPQATSPALPRGLP